MQKIFEKILRLKDEYQSNIVFDTRLINKNDIFIGIGTGSKNGSIYYRDALKKESKLIIINDNKIKHEDIFYVQNINNFIKNFCKYLLLKYKGKIIAITGSVGKTTIKENIYNILSQNNFSVSKSYKNYNNLLGLQFSIMNINLYNKYSIFELGINNPGEMKNLVKILNPHYCLITCIENSHIGNFKNFDNLIDNKLNIFDSSNLIKGVLNFRHKNIDISDKVSSKINYVNIDEIKKKVVKNKIFKIDYFFKNIKYSINSDHDGVYTEIAILTSIFLKSFISSRKINNFFLNESILESRGNLLVKSYKSKKIKIYNHSYNASPYSLKKQLMIFKQRKLMHKLCIIGSMKELGEESGAHHLEILRLLSDFNFYKTVLVGNEFYKLRNLFKSFKFYKSTQNYIKSLDKDLINSKNIFIMGSRFHKLERIIDNVK
jgi:UDP-N-acetylmuramoyl-tripeptide--D-alanyl-D-alanine ligase